MRPQTRMIIFAVAIGLTATAYYFASGRSGASGDSSTNEAGDDFDRIITARVVSDNADNTPTVIRKPEKNPSPPSDSFSTESIASSENVRRFGERRWRELSGSNTLLFVDGKYIGNPIVVSVRGLGVYLNDELVDYVEWPGKNFLDQMPAPPDHIDASSTPNDLMSGVRIKESWPYLVNCWIVSAHKSREDQERAFLETYRLLPFVRETKVIEIPQDLTDPASFGPRREMRFTTNDGTHYTIPRWFYGKPPSPAQDVSELLDSKARRYFDLISTGGLIAFINGNCVNPVYQKHRFVMTFAPRSEAFWILPEVIEAVENRKQAPNIFRQLRPRLKSTPGFRQQHECLFDQWAKSFEGTPQLNKKLTQIKGNRPEGSYTLAQPHQPDQLSPTVDNLPTDSSEVPAGLPKELNEAINDMIALLEQRKFPEFVEKYIRPEYRRLYKYEGNEELDETSHYDFNAQPKLLEMYIKNLQTIRNLTPVVVNDNEAVFTFWHQGGGPSEKVLHRDEGRWYFK